jgi:streptogramin lyase
MPSLSTPAARVPTLVALIITAGALLISIACGSSATAPPASATGSLSVTITAPANVTPSVKVTGPNGYNTTLSATTTLTGLTVGSYSIAAAPVTIPNLIVNTLATATVAGSPATVTASGTQAAATATYSIRPGTGGLWVSSFVEIGGAFVSEYSASQLASGGNPLPAGLVGGTETQYAGVAFDANGNLWVAAEGQGLIVQYPANQLTSNGASPTLSITTPATPDGLAFDAAGDLWVTEPTANSVVMYTPTQLGATGSPVPMVTIGASGTSLALPQGLAFDASGNLWVANYDASDIVEFTPAQLAANGTPTPAVTIGPYASGYATNGSDILWGPLALAFDPSGNLWVANGSAPAAPLLNPTLVELSASSLTTSGTPAPIFTADVANVRPFGLAFDVSGDLWMSNRTSAELLEVLPTQPPTVTVPGIGVSVPFGLAFNPHPNGLPIKP